jgi:hypothetical protein
MTSGLNEVGQPFDAGGTGFGDAAGAAAAGAVVDLGGQQLGEVGQGVAFADGGLGEPGRRLRGLWAVSPRGRPCYFRPRTSSMQG